MSREVVFAPAKVNLALHVTGRRADGYHLIDSLVVFAAIGDRLMADLDGRDGPHLTITGPFADALAGDGDNLVLKAARALAQAGDVPPATVAATRLVLEKCLPVASGIGGGSADAAATFVALDRLWQMHLPVEQLAAIGLALGADVPMCLAATPAQVSGIGENIAPVRLPQLALLLVNPLVAVATVDVFRGLDRRDNAPLPPLPAEFVSPAALARWLAQTRNDLTTSAEKRCPAIGDVRAALAGLPGVLHAGMSGSGATCFAVCADDAAAAANAARLRANYPQWWIAAGRSVSGAGRPGAT